MDSGGNRNDGEFDHTPYLDFVIPAKERHPVLRDIPGYSGYHDTGPESTIRHLGSRFVVRGASGFRFSPE